jgi:hypothetical protein
VAGDQGLLSSVEPQNGLRRIHTGSAPLKIPGLQHAFRFRDQDWSGEISVRRESADMLSETMHILSVAEGVVYGSSIMTLRISGAPVDKLNVMVDKNYKNIEFTGSSIADWKKTGEKDDAELWQINFKNKIIGDYTLLASYEKNLNSSERGKMRIGGISLSGTSSESGFIAVTSARNLDVKTASLSGTASEIEGLEIPVEYRRMLHNPVLKAYRFNSKQSVVEAELSNLEPTKLLDLIIDHSRLRTTFDKNGQAETVVEYRLKNASKQFLQITLPKDAILWELTINEQKKIISLSDGKLLLPLPKNKDCNEPIAVKIRYAQKFGELSSFKKLEMSAPFTKTENMFSTWKIQAPINYNISDYDGNMTALKAPQKVGIQGIFTRFANIAEKTFQPHFLLSFILSLLSVCAIAKSIRSAGKLRFIVIPFAALIAIFAVMMAGAGLISGLRSLTEIVPRPVNTCEFTRLFSLPEDCLKINLEVSDMEAFSWGNLLRLCVYLPVGLLIAGAGMIMVKGKFLRFLIYAVGVSLILAGIGQWLYLNAIAALLLFVLPLISIFAAATLLSARGIKSKAIALIILPLFFLSSDLVSQEITIEKVSYLLSADDKSVNGEAELAIRSSSSKSSIPFLFPPAAILDNAEKDSSVEIKLVNGIYYLTTDSSGDHRVKFKFITPINENKDGSFSFQFHLPECAENKFLVKSAKENFEPDSANAVTLAKDAEKSEILMSFQPASTAFFTLKPKARDMEKEEVKFFAGANALAKFASGYIETNYDVGLDIVQGEESKFLFKIPQNMNVTSVNAPFLGAWKYEKNVLETLLTKSCRGKITVKIITQISGQNLPYNAEISMIEAVKADKQYGVIGIAADEHVQIQEEKTSGLNKINLTDFPQNPGAGLTLKKAYRYHTLPVSAAVSASAVNAEIRVDEDSQIFFGDEKTTLKSKLSMDIAKAGIFAMTIDIPEGFDIDKITGAEIKLWDETTAGGSHKVIINFNKSISGPAEINLELSAPEQKRAAEMKAPKITVKNALRHKGKLALRSERGARIDILSREGLEIRRDLSDISPVSSLDSIHNFAILREDWELGIKLETIQSWLQAETLQIAKISEGTLDFTAILNYSIENAGAKKFTVKLPQGASQAEFAGNDIANVRNSQDNVWEIELHRKVMGRYSLNVKFRLPCELKEELLIKPVTAVGAELQKGYLVVSSSDTLQIQEAGKSGEITDFDARKIPSDFKTDVISGAVLSYRTIGADYALKLGVLKHKAAEMLRAQIKSLTINSSISSEGKLINKLSAGLNNASDNFLAVKLPEKSTLWSVFVDNQPVDAAIEKGKILVPLKQDISGRGREQNVEIIYSLETDKEWTEARQFYKAPSFDLPLKNVSWKLFLPRDIEYRNFDGTLDYMSHSIIENILMSTEEYDRFNREIISGNIEKAKTYLSKATSLASEGKQEEANEAFQNAQNFSTVNKELNADVQGQWLQNMRTQSLSTLSSRRMSQKKAFQPQQQEIEDEKQAVHQPPAPSQTAAIEDITQELSGDEIDNLQKISDKVFIQQQQASTMPQPIRPTIPEDGAILDFSRTLEVSSAAPLDISFSARKKFLNMKNLKTPSAFAAVAGILLLSFLLLSKIAVKKEPPSENLN